MRGSRNFRQGGPGHYDQKKSSDNVFFLVLSLFYRSQTVNFKEIYHFLRFQRGSNIFQGGGGVQLFPGRGSNCLFPIETHITCDFPGGGGWSGPPVPPLDPHLPNRENLQPYMTYNRNSSVNSVKLDRGVQNESLV